MNPGKNFFPPGGPEISGGAVQLREEPGARDLPVAEHGVGRDTDHLGGLPDAQPAEVSQFHDSSLARVHRG